MEKNNNSNFSNNRFIFIFVLMVVMIMGSFFVGVAIGSEQSNVEAEMEGLMEEITELDNQEEEKPEAIDFSIFWQTWKALEENHIRGTEVSAQDRVWSAVKGLTYAYDDPHTVFMPPQESKDFETEISGQFEGVGMEIGERDDILTVVAPLKGTPAYKAGVQAGDKIIEIDGESTGDVSIDQAVKLIRGEKGTEVVLTLIREGEIEPLEISIIRGVIDIPTIETEMRDDGIFVIKLFNFAGQSITKYQEAMVEFERSGADKLILDLRNNPGGFLQASVEVASYFLPAGEVILKENFRDEREVKVYRSKGYSGVKKDTEMVVLINQGSASASEIVAGALSDHGVATTVGYTTFGKGSVQEVMKLTSDTSLKVTIAEWLTPEGHSFEKVGIEPDVLIEVTREDFEQGVDPQLDEAIRILLND